MSLQSRLFGREKPAPLQLLGEFEDESALPADLESRRAVAVIFDRPLARKIAIVGNSVAPGELPESLSGVPSFRVAELAACRALPDGWLEMIANMKSVFGCTARSNPR